MFERFQSAPVKDGVLKRLAEGKAIFEKFSNTVQRGVDWFEPLREFVSKRMFAPLRDGNQFRSRLPAKASCMRVDSLLGINSRFRHSPVPL